MTIDQQKLVLTIVHVIIQIKVEILKDDITYYLEYQTIYGIKLLHFLFLVVVGYIEDVDYECIEDVNDKYTEDGYKEAK